MSQDSFFQFWSALFLKPKTFFKKQLEEGKKSPAYFLVAYSLYAIAYGIDKMDKRLVKYDLQKDIENFNFLNQWNNYIVTVIISGIVGGIISYYVAGWFYDIRVRWCRGEKNLKRSRLFRLYSRNVFSIGLILVTIAMGLIEGSPYGSESGSGLLGICSVILIIASMYYSIYVGYCGAKSIEGVSLKRVKWWFLILPVVFMTFTYAGIFLLFAYLWSLA